MSFLDAMAISSQFVVNIILVSNAVKVASMLNVLLERGNYTKVKYGTLHTLLVSIYRCTLKYGAKPPEFPPAETERANLATHVRTNSTCAPNFHSSYR